MKIRPSTSGDVDQIVGLWKEFMHDPASIDRPVPTHEENTRRWREFVGKLIGEDRKQVYVAEEDGKLVGYVMCQRESKSSPLELPYKWSYISDLYVKQAHRGRGIGKMLMQACLEYLKSIGSEHVRLSVWHMNKKAIGLYADLGFKPHMDIMQAEL